MENDEKIGEQLLKEINQLRIKISEMEKSKTRQTKKNFSDYLLETANIVILTLDIDANITMFNKFAEKLTGYKKDEVLEENWFDLFIPKRNGSVIPEVFQDVLKEMPDVSSHENHILCKNGTERLISWKNTLLKDENGEISGVLSIGSDITEQKKAEKALEESENNLRTLFNAMKDIVMEINYDGRFIYIAPTSPDFLFKSSNDLIGKTIHEIFPKPEADIFFEFIRKVLDENKINTIEYPLSIKNKRIWFEGRAIPKTKNSVLYVARNITERKQAGKKLKNSEERFRQISENSQEWIWEMDSNGLYTFASQIVEDMLGYKSEEIVGKKHFYDLFLPEEHDALKSAAFKAFKLKQPFKEFINRNLTKDGKIIWLSTSGVPILDNNGNLLGYRGVDVNITERKEAEEALLASEEKFRDIANLLPQIVYEVDLIGNLTFVNQQAYESFGYLPEDFEKGINVMQAIVPEDRDKAKENIQNVIYGKSVGTPEYTALRKDGSTFPVLIYSNLVLKDKKPAGLRGIIVDITDRKQADEELKKRMSDLEIFNDAAVDREIIINDHRKEINKLLKKLGKKEKFEIVE